MSKNTKKKNAIRFGALAVAALIFLGVFSAWALSTQATATAETGEIMTDGITVDGVANQDELLMDSIAGRPGRVAEDYELYTIDTANALEANEYTAIVYLVNGPDLMEEGLRSLTLNLEHQDGEDLGTLTLENGRVAFTFDHDDYDGETENIVINGGSYSTHPFANFNGEDIEFMIDVEPGALSTD